MNARTLLLLALMTSTLCCCAQGQEAGKELGALTAHATKPAGSAVVADDSYIIGASDQLTITVWKDPTLSGTLLVRPDGKISMPLLGDLQAAGQKPMQLAADISGKLTKFMRDPEVSVVVLQIHNNYVYLLGEVGKKGPIVLTPGMTLLEAISTAGGLTDFANKKKIYILRSVGGKQQKLPVNYKKALKGDADLNVTLTPGDTIVVP